MDFKVRFKNLLNKDLGNIDPHVEVIAGAYRGGLKGAIIGCLIGVIIGVIKGEFLSITMICSLSGCGIGWIIGGSRAGGGKLYKEAFLSLMEDIKRIFLFIFHLFKSGRQK